MNPTPTAIKTKGHARGVSLTVLPPDSRRRLARTGRRRTGLMIVIYLLIIAHVIQWRITGWTISPLVASDAMFTLESGVVNGGAIILGVIILATLIFGRFICGWGCHMGGLQDLCAWIMRRCGARPHPFRARLLGYVPLALGLYMFVWPTFGREVLQPALRAWWPDALGVIGHFHEFPGWSASLTTDNLWARLPGVWIAIPFLLVCGFATVYFLGGRGFCRYACPYGGVLAPLERLSPTRIRVDRDACDRCGLCTAVCSTGVRVMDEVWAHGRIVSNTCLKTLDCVSVCPTRALSVGPARPGLLHRRLGASERPRAVYDLSWGEELLVLGSFAAVFFVSRGLYALIPMLMAAGIAVCASFIAWKLWRLVRDDNVRFAGMQLKRSRRLQPSGAVFAALGLAGVALVAHSSVVKVLVWRAGVMDSRVTTPREVVFGGLRDLIPAETITAARRALALYDAAASIPAGGIGLASTPAADHRAAWLFLVCGEPAEAEARLRRVMARSETGDTFHADLARVMLMQGDADRAIAHLERVAASGPAYPQSRHLLCSLYLGTGRPDRAIAACQTVLAAAPRDGGTRALLAAVLIQTGRAREAIEHLRTAVTHEPRRIDIRRDLAMALYSTGDLEGAIRTIEEAAAIDRAAEASLSHLAAVLLADSGRDQEAEAWLKRARIAGEPTSGGNP